MATDTPSLPPPGQQDAMVRVLSAHVAREEEKLLMRMARWKIASAYHLGHRRFEVFDPYGSRIASAFLDKDGKIPLQVSKMVSEVNRIDGVLASMDLRPVVSSDAYSIGSVRDAAIARATINGVRSESEHSAFYRVYRHYLLMFGCVGAGVDVVEHPQLGLTDDWEVIHPGELLPWPSLHGDLSKQRGVIRRRYVPLSWVAARWPKAGEEAVVRKMEVYRRQVGDGPGQPPWASVPAGQISFPPGTPQRKPEDHSQERLVRLNQLWEWGARGTCSRQVVTSGEVVLYDSAEHPDGSVYYPGVYVTNFIESGDMHGLGMYDLLFSSVREFEKLIKDTINNVRDLDRYPPVVLPNGTFNVRSHTQENGRAMKFVFVSPEPTYTGESGVRPMVLPLHNAGDTPLRTVAFLQGIIEGISPLRDLVSEKGRVDSLGGLQFLDERGLQPMAGPLRNVADTMGCCYRAICAKAIAAAVGRQRALPVSVLSSELAGAVIDWDSGTFSFARNPLPDLSRLHFGVRQSSPQSKAIRKQEALELVERGISSVDRLVTLALRENIDLAMDLSAERAAQQTVTYNILRIYNDGETPGQAVVTPHNTILPARQLRELEAFMASPAVLLASPQVQDALADYRATLMGYLQQVIPESVPDPYLTAGPVLPDRPEEGTVPQPQAPRLSA